LLARPSKTIDYYMSEKEHQCKTISFTNSKKYRFLKINLSKDKWIFEYKTGKYAVNQDEVHLVANDRISFACSLVVNFCPHCGDKLSSEKSTLLPLISSQQEDEGVEKIHLCLPLKEYNCKNPEIGSSEDKNGLWKVVGEQNLVRGYRKWMLDRYSFATEQKVQDGRAEQIGELCFEYGFGISFCPFCGASLPEEILSNQSAS
jgi:hypothetical protein